MKKGKVLDRLTKETTIKTSVGFLMTIGALAVVWVGSYMNLQYQVAQNNDHISDLAETVKKIDERQDAEDLALVRIETKLANIEVTLEELKAR